MTLTKQHLQYITIGLMVVLLLGTGYALYRRHQYESTAEQLRGSLALASQTIEIQQGVYEKVAAENTNLKDLLNSKDTQEKRLKDEIKKQKQELASVTQISVKWKTAYESLLVAGQIDVPPVTPGDPARKRVDFQKEWNLLKVQGYTLTDPPQAWVKVEQNQPLRLTVAVTEGPTGVWKVFTTSSDDNVSIDVGLAAVNPLIFQPKWYEKIQVRGDLGIGDGMLVGVGAQYQMKQFDVGPSFWLTAGNEIDTFAGMSVT